MKYCRHCGKVLSDDATLCLNCGCSTQIKTEEAYPEGYNVLCILGLIFAFIMPIVGFVLSLIGLNQVNKNPEQNGKGLAIAGIAVSAATVFFIIIFVYIVLLAMGSYFDAITSVGLFTNIFLLF